MAARLLAEDCRRTTVAVRVKLCPSGCWLSRQYGRLGLIDSSVPIAGGRVAVVRRPRKTACGVLYGWKYDVTGQGIEVPSTGGKRLLREDQLNPYPLVEARRRAVTHMGAGCGPAASGVESRRCGSAAVLRSPAGIELAAGMEGGSIN